MALTQIINQGINFSPIIEPTLDIYISQFLHAAIRDIIVALAEFRRCLGIKNLCIHRIVFQEHPFYILVAPGADTIAFTFAYEQGIIDIKRLPHVFVSRALAVLMVEQGITFSNDLPYVGIVSTNIKSVIALYHSICIMPAQTKGILPVRQQAPQKHTGTAIPNPFPIKGPSIKGTRFRLNRYSRILYQ